MNKAILLAILLTNFTLRGQNCFERCSERLNLAVDSLSDAKKAEIMIDDSKRFGINEKILKELAPRWRGFVIRALH